MSTVFEKLLSGEWPCAKVYEDDRVFAFMDAGQVNDGHVIVATKQPFETLLDMDEDTAAALMRAAWKIARAVQAAFEPEGITHEYYDHSYHRLAVSGQARFGIVDIADCEAMEVDDVADLRRAEARLMALAQR